MIECIRSKIFGVEITSKCSKCGGTAIVQMPDPTRLNYGLYWEKICLNCKAYYHKEKPKSEWIKNEFAENVVSAYCEKAPPDDIIKQNLEKLLKNE